MQLNVSTLFRSARAILIGQASSGFAFRGEVHCLVDGKFKRRECVGRYHVYDAQSTFIDMLLAEDPFQRCGGTLPTREECWH